MQATTLAAAREEPTQRHLQQEGLAAPKVLAVLVALVVVKLRVARAVQVAAKRPAVQAAQRLDQGVEFVCWFIIA